jgi:hypothetical protein
MKNHRVTQLFWGKLMSIFMVFLGAMLLGPNLIGQQLEIEWDGTEQDVIRLIEGGRMRFSIEGHTAATPDRITFKIRSGDTLINALTLYEGGTVRLEKVDTILMNATNVVRKADGTLGVRQYKMGDFAQGGIVFWVDETGEHGLVADTADISSGIQWYNGVPKVTNASGDGVGSGKMNTMLIIAQQTVDNPAGNFAALVCANLRRGPYGDWYLPSKEELNLMYQNRAAINATALANGGSAFANSAYWSSTELDASNAWYFFFSHGFTSFYNKTGPLRVRAIRAF